MAHPYESMKNHNVSKSRVSKITHGSASSNPKIHRASGGRIPLTEAKMAAKVEGEASPRRADRVQRRKRASGGVASSGSGAYEASQNTKALIAAGLLPKPEAPKDDEKDRPARKSGGRVKTASVNINIISPPAPPADGPPPMLPPPGPPPMPPMPPGAGPMPPRPPMGPGGPGMAGSGPSGLPGMMPRAAGGRAYAKGGAVKSGRAWMEGKKNGTPVEHDPAKSPEMLGEAYPKRATGGKVGKLNAPQGVAPATKLPGGAGGGLGRLAKVRKYGPK